MRHATMLVLALSLMSAVQTLEAQRSAVRRYDATSSDIGRPTAYAVQRGSWRRELPHYGKWLTAAGTVALTVFAAREHRHSRRNWDALLTICRSADAACAVGSDGRYLRSDAELLYQRSRVFDRRANRWLLGAQASLLVTTALFIIDLRPGQGPDNIPFPGDLAVTPLPNGAAVGMRVAF